MAIRIQTKPCGQDLTGKSHFWGFPDLPQGIDYPCKGDIDEDGTEETLTFICQIHLEEIAGLDTEGMLPHTGMLYFFADLDYFLGDYDAPCEGMGPWGEEYYRVIYCDYPPDEPLYTHKVFWSDGSPACRPAEAINFLPSASKTDSHRLLGKPFYEEVEDAYPDHISLFQLDEDERWNLRFYDMGTLNFLITPDDLENRRFDKVKVYCHSL